MFVRSTDSSIPIGLLKPRNLPLEQAPLEEEVVSLFLEFRHPLLRYMVSFGLPTHDAEEIVQEVFLALFQHLRRGKPRSNLRGWVFRVGHNLALKQRKRNRRSMLQSSEYAVENRQDPSPGPDERLLSAQRQAQLLAVFEKLPELDRCCLNLRAEGLRYREIASVLGISLGGVALSLSRSLNRLARTDTRSSK
jgi:RNA polymerase sigma-70 factor (ECF subfamily)